MKLFFSGNSPYARRPRMAVREFGLGNVEVIDVAPLTAPDAEVKKHGPGGKVPALMTDDGTFLCETLIVCRQLDDASGGKLYPKEGKARTFAYKLEGIAQLLMDSLFHRSHEIRRDPKEQSPGEIEKEAGRAKRCYDELESLVGDFDGKVDMSTLSVVAALGYADWRHPGDEWRAGRPKLAAWYDKMMQRPSCAETKPVF